MLVRWREACAAPPASTPPLPSPPKEHLAENLFTPAAIAAGRDTVTIQFPTAGAAGAALKASGAFDDAAVAGEIVVTCDPAVVAELNERADDFPKMWTRPAQVGGGGVGGGGVAATRLLTANASPSPPPTSSRSPTSPGTACSPARRPAKTGRRAETEGGGEGEAGCGVGPALTPSPSLPTGPGLIPRAFNALKIKAMYPSVLDAARQLAAELGAAAARTAPAPVPSVDDWITAMTADAVVKVSLGMQMHNVKRLAAGEPVHDLLSSFAFGLKHAFGRSSRRDLAPAERPRGPFGVKKALALKYARCKAACAKNVADLVEATRAGELSGVGGEPTLLASLLTDVSPVTGKKCRLDALYG